VKQKLIVLEGPDGVGKTTQSKILANMYNAKLIVQPSQTNYVSFIRNEVKNNPSHNAFARQLLHTVSHVVDIFTEFDTTKPIIMDRCHISTYVYGRTTDMTEEQNKLLFRIHKDIYSQVIKDNFDVSIIFFGRSNKYLEDPTDQFEKMIKWDELKKQYVSFFDYLSNGDDFVFTPSENIYYLPLCDKSTEEITSEVYKLIEKGI